LAFNFSAIPLEDWWVMGQVGQAFLRFVIHRILQVMSIFQPAKVAGNCQRPAIAEKLKIETTLI